MYSLPAILLAAGSSSRLGRPKQLLPHPLDPTTTLLRHAAQTALSSTCHPLIVVLGAHAARCAAELINLPVTIILNPAHAEGLASSIRAGVAACRVRCTDHLPNDDGCTTPNDDASATLPRHPDATPNAPPAAIPGVLLLLCDQPHITPALLDSLVAAHAAGHPIVASAYANTLGVPAVFDRRFFPDLLSLRGDTGAKSLLRIHAALVHPIPFPEGALDVDAPTDCRPPHP